MLINIPVLNTVIDVSESLTARAAVTLIAEKLSEVQIAHDKIVFDLNQLVEAIRRDKLHLISDKDELVISFEEYKRVQGALTENLRTDLAATENQYASLEADLNARDESLTIMREANSRLGSNYLALDTKMTTTLKELEEAKSAATRYEFWREEDKVRIDVLSSAALLHDATVNDMRVAVEVALGKEKAIRGELESRIDVPPSLERELRQLSMMQAANICGPADTPETYLDVAGKFLAYLKGTDNDNQK